MIKSFLHSFFKFDGVIVIAICVLMAIALQIQTTLFASDGYLGIRISLADLILPFAGVFIGLELLTKKSDWPKWCMPNVYLWLAGMTGVLVLAGIHAYFLYGHIGTWAIGNKLGGWPVLIAFLLMGGWIGSNAKTTHIQNFIKVMLYFGLTVLAYQCFFAFLQSFESIRPITGWYKHIEYFIPGLMKNRNAYAFLMLTIYGFVIFQFFAKKAFVPRYIINIYIALFPVFLTYNASRAAIIAAIIYIPLTIILNFSNKKKIIKFSLLIALNSFLLLALLHDKGNAVALISHTPKEIFQEAKLGQSLSEIKENIEYSGDDMRLTVLEGALEIFKQNPVFGSGLGANLEYQERVHGKIINILDSTPAWLITETGIAGFLFFCAFYIFVVQAIILKLKHDDDFAKFIRLSSLFMILTFTVMCIFHEILYTRHIWFILGIALTLPSKTRHPE